MESGTSKRWQFFDPFAAWFGSCNIQTIGKVQDVQCTTYQSLSPVSPSFLIFFVMFKKKVQVVKWSFKCWYSWVWDFHIFLRLCWWKKMENKNQTNVLQDIVSKLQDACFLADVLCVQQYQLRRARCLTAWRFYRFFIFTPIFGEVIKFD